MRFLLILSLLLTSVTSFAQKGTLKGVVKDAANGEELIGVNVVIEGTAIGASSNMMGEYQFMAEPGTYTIVASFIGFVPEKKEVTLAAGETKVIDFAIAEDAVSLAEVVVVGEADRTSDNILLMQRKDAAVAIESIGARELSAKGVSDVKAGLVKMSGVSQVSSRGVYVRGLGDRYNNAYLNGLPLPSPNPNLKVIELDLFPTAIVRNIEVSKTYQVSQFGDMSGASINIFTKDPAAEDFLRLSLGTNYNSQASFQDFRISQDGDADYFGLSGNGRKAPIAVDLNRPYNFGETAEDPFPTGFDRQAITAPLDQTYSLQAGKNIEVGSGELGVLFSGSYRNSFRSDEGINDVVDAQLTSERDFNRQRDIFTTNLTGLLGVQYKINNDHRLNLNYLFINNSTQSDIVSRGNTFEDENSAETDLVRIRNRYLQTQLQNAQLLSENKLADRLYMKWGGSYASSKTDEPNRRDLSFILPETAASNGMFTDLGSNQNQRYYQETAENEYNGYGEFKYGLGPALTEDAEARHFLVAGYQLKYKERSDASRVFQLNAGPEIAQSVVDINQLDAVLNDAAYSQGRYFYTDANADGSSQAEAKRLLNAGYAYAELNLSNRLKVVPGVRAEHTQQIVYYKQLGTSFTDPFLRENISELNLLPAVNVKYSLSDEQVLRFAASKTLTRPNFRELIPVPYVNENLQSIVGNPDLINSAVYNADIKYDIYPNTGELYSVGAFYKRIDSPIEQIQSGVNYLTFQNFAFADVYGVELEASKRLGTLLGGSELASGFFVDGNASLMLSNVSVDADRMKNESSVSAVQSATNKERSLQGASPYIVNFSLGYDNPLFTNAEESSIRLTYNTFGKRIYSVGILGLGDTYEMPFGTLDLVLQNSWNNGFGVKLSAKNLLNPAIERRQEAGLGGSDASVLTQSYRAGMNVGLSVTYNLNFNR